MLKQHVSIKGHKKLLIQTRASSLKAKMSSNIKTLTLLEFRHFVQSAGSHCAILSDGTKEKKATKAQLTYCKQETPEYKTRNLPEIT